jgi:diguanylate cyclase (GGDEF)-like protein/PAS domain S-box-containing protein
MKDARHPITDAGGGAGDDGDLPVQPKQGQGVHGGASYGAATGRRSDVVLPAILAAVVAVWTLTLILSRGVQPLEAVGAILLTGGSWLAVSALLRSDSRRLAVANREVAEQTARADALFGASPSAMWVWDPDTLQVLDANAAASRVLGWSHDELLDMTVAELQVDATPRQLRNGEYEGEWTHRRRDGASIPTVVGTTEVQRGGHAVRVSIVHDLTLERENAARTRAIVDNAADAILTIDLDGVVESANPMAEQMFGYPATTLVGENVAALMKAPDGSALPSSVVAFGREVIGVRADSSTFPLELSVQDVALGDRTVSTVIARDVTDRKALEHRLTSQATHDSLTGLPNRLLLIDRLGHALERAERSGRPLAVLFCDLDRFKVVNDSLGHTAGDAMLFAVANRLRSAVRHGDTVARFGGDEFVVLAEDLSGETDAVRVAEQVMAALAAPVRVGGQDLHITVSVGIAVGRPGRDTAEALVRDADAAMYRAKSGGRNRAEVFDAELRRQALERLEIEGAMRRGIDAHEFVVHYQPELDVRTGEIVGVEALVRWERPGDGTRSPGAFLPVAEETGLIVALGASVLHQACAEARRWHAEVGDRAPTVWVNLSAKQLASLDLIPMIEAAVRDLPRPSALGLEITETDIVPDDEISRRTMDALVDIGVRLAIDDFGTGYASLSYLWRFPAHVVKIDQSFVRRMATDRDADLLVKAMIDMAHSLEKHVVAEGVETDEQLNRLRELGADTVQGYLLGRPAPGSHLDAFLLAI